MSVDSFKYTLPVGGNRWQSNLFKVRNWFKIKINLGLVKFSMEVSGWFIWTWKFRSPQGGLSALDHAWAWILMKVTCKMAFNSSVCHMAHKEHKNECIIKTNKYPTLSKYRHVKEMTSDRNPALAKTLTTSKHPSEESRNLYFYQFLAPALILIQISTQE